MNFTKDELTLEEGLTKEWIITNGIGGFCSSTIIGANTRKYHGLLVAPLTPPARRFLILSKLDESIELNNKKYELFTNIGKEYITHGYKYQEGFRKEYIPIFTYKVEDIEITKMICMQYGKNIVGIYYKIKNGKENAKLNLAPILNFRDFHSVNNNHEFVLKQDIKNDTKVKITIDDNSSYPIYIKISEGSYIRYENNTFRDMFYIEEEKRGFLAEENHSVTRCFSDRNKARRRKRNIICMLIRRKYR